jgi:HK97 family phage prohead protease
MPTPRAGETEEEFIERCIPIVLEDGTADDDEQAVAVCYSMWEEREGRAMRTNGMERKVVPFAVDALDFEGRTVEGYASVFGNVDQGNDIVHRGAFTKTLQERGDSIKFLWQHNSNEPLGRPIDMREDERGLFVKAVVSDTQRGRDVLALLRDGAIDGMSIGYEPVKGGTDYTEVDGARVRNLKEIKLYEFSLVTFPMNEDATVTALKAAMRSESDGKHPSSHYLVVEDPEKPSTWHLRVRDVNGDPDHRLMGAAWAALHGGYRGNRYEGPDKQEAIRKLRALYEQEDMEPPGESALDLLETGYFVVADDGTHIPVFKDAPATGQAAAKDSETGPEEPPEGGPNAPPDSGPESPDAGPVEPPISDRLKELYELREKLLFMEVDSGQDTRDAGPSPAAG